MKKLIPFSTLALAAGLLFTAGTAQAQRGYILTNGNTIKKVNVKDEASMSFGIVNKSGAKINLHWELLENSIDNGGQWDFSFCDLVNCYATLPMSGTNPLDTSAAGGTYKLDVMTNEKSGSGKFRVVINEVGKEDLKDTLTFEVTTTSSIAANSAQVNLSVFPNPTTDNITINSADAGFIPVSARVFNILGEEVAAYAMTGSATQSINVASLPEGTYMVRIAGQNGAITTRRFLKAQ